MTAVEFAKAMDYDYTTIIRWLKKGLVPGAEFVEISGKFGVWRIPESAMNMPIPRLGRKKKAAKSGSEEAGESMHLAPKRKKSTKKMRKKAAGN